jgi:hypothetical protein
MDELSELTGLGETILTSINHAIFLISLASLIPRHQQCELEYVSLCLSLDNNYIRVHIKPSTLYQFLNAMSIFMAPRIV